MQDQDFSAEQSLKVIQSMIEKAKEDLSMNAFFYLLWGWLIFIAAIAQYVLLVIVQYPKHYLVWMLMWVGAIVSIVYGIRAEKKPKVVTYMGESMMYFGLGTGISFTILSWIISYNNLWLYAFPVYLVLYGFGSFIGGAILRFSVLRWSAAACWVIAAVSVLVEYQFQLLLMALSVLVAYIIPGYLLQNKHKKQML